MATLNNLADLLNGLGINTQPNRPTCQQQAPTTTESPTSYPRRQPHHELWFEYPALHLLKNIDNVWLPEVENLDYRPEPDGTHFQLNEYGLEFYHIMEPNFADAAMNHVSDPQTLFVFNSIDSLASIVGKTTVSVVRHIEDSYPQYRIRLESLSDGETKTAMWDLGVDQWASLLSINRPWVHLLRDLVKRKSGRAYLAARVTMQRHSSTFADEDAKTCKERWETREPRNASQLVIRLLHTQEGIVRLQNFAFNGSCTVKLPCDDFVPMTVDEYQHKDGKFWMNLRCPDCNERVLQDDDLAEAAMIDKLAKLEESIEEHSAWKDLDQAVMVAESRQFQSETVIAALLAAATSLELPELIVPALLQPLNFEETATALKTMVQWFVQEGSNILASPQELRKAFEIIVQQGLRETCVPREAFFVPTPPGWTRFLHLWLDRTMNLLTRRRCSDHAGIHWHGDGTLWCGDSQAEVQQRDDLLAKLGDLSFGSGGQGDTMTD